MARSVAAWDDGEARKEHGTMDPWMGRDRLANKLKTLPHAPMQFPRRRVTFFAHTLMGM